MAEGSRKRRVEQRANSRLALAVVRRRWIRRHLTLSLASQAPARPFVQTSEGPKFAYAGTMPQRCGRCWQSE